MEYFYFIKKEESLFLNWDEMLDLWIDNFQKFTKYLFSKIDREKLRYLIIDEAQYIKNIWLILKILIDKVKAWKFNSDWLWDFKIIASWSGSLEVFRWITDSLIWRKKIINIYPLSFLEFLQYKKYNIDSLSLDSIQDWQINEIFVYFDEFINYWSYPEIVFTYWEKEKLKLLDWIYSDYIYKDIWFYLKTDEIISFDKFLKYVWYWVCTCVKIDNIVKTIWVSRELVKKFLFLVENTFVLNLLSAFTKNKQKEVSKHKKVYFTDLWFLRKVLWVTTIDYENKWKFTENFVFLELLKYKDTLENIYFWQKKNWSEVDFILEDSFSWKIKPIEVKTWSNDNIPIIFKSFLCEYNEIIENFYVLNKDIIKKRDLKDKEVFILSYLLLFKEF